MNIPEIHGPYRRPRPTAGQFAFSAAAHLAIGATLAYAVIGWAGWL